MPLEVLAGAHLDVRADVLAGVLADVLGGGAEVTAAGCADSPSFVGAVRPIGSEFS